VQADARLDYVFCVTDALLTLLSSLNKRNRMIIDCVAVVKSVSNPEAADSHD